MNSILLNIYSFWLLMQSFYYAHKIVTLVVLAFFTVSFLYGLFVMYSKAKSDVTGKEKNALSWAFASSLIVVAIFYFLLGNSGKMLKLEDTTVDAEMDKKSQYVQLNDVIGVDRTVESYNQYMAKYISEHHANDKEIWNRGLISQITLHEKRENSMIYVAGFAGGGGIVFEANGNGYIFGATVFLPESYPLQMKKQIMSAAMFYLTAVTIDSRVLNKVIDEAVEYKDNVAFWSVEARRNFILKSREDVQKNDNSNIKSTVVNISAFVEK